MKRAHRNYPFLPRTTAGVTSGAAAAGTAPGIMLPIGIRPTSWIFNVFCRDREVSVYGCQYPNVLMEHKFGFVFTPGKSQKLLYLMPVPHLCQHLPITFRSSLRSEISRSVRLAMSWTNCWILGGYSLGALSRGALASASPLRWLLLLSCRAAQTSGTCCLVPPK